MHSPLLATLTHARLRVAQGDVAAAREILHELLAREPGNEEARSLLEALSDCPERPRRASAERPLTPPEPGDPRQLAEKFGVLRDSQDDRRARKIRRLRDWARRIAAEKATGPPVED